MRVLLLVTRQNKQIPGSSAQGCGSDSPVVMPWWSQGRLGALVCTCRCLQRALAVGGGPCHPATIGALIITYTILGGSLL